ncbi:MAG: GTPase domain-containing protein, partial [Cellulomonadaceae bacterium]|nr:GTPase domain-containing protein [Cellulomonadaceae bacterium]
MTVPDDATAPTAGDDLQPGSTHVQGNPVPDAPVPDASDSDAATPSLTAGALTSSTQSGVLLDALNALRGRLAALRLPLTVTGVEAARADKAAAIAQLDDYLIPRMRAEKAPLLVVVGGSTGSGKSTLVNSILGERVSAPGVLRPTTRSPVLVHHPLDARWFTDDRVLPGLARQAGAMTENATSTRGLRLVACEALPQGMALLDAPDIDS